MPKSKENTTSRLIYIPNDLNREIEKIKSDINYKEDRKGKEKLDLRDTCIELIRIGAKVKIKQLDNQGK